MKIEIICKSNRKISILIYAWKLCSTHIKYFILLQFQFFCGFKNKYTKREITKKKQVQENDNKKNLKNFKETKEKKTWKFKNKLETATYERLRWKKSNTTQWQLYKWPRPIMLPAKCIVLRLRLHRYV